MTLYSAVNAELPYLRAQAESRMVSRCAVMRDMGMQPNPETGLEEPTWATVHADVAFRLAGSSQGRSSHRTVTVGGTELTVATREAHFPADTSGLQHEDLLEITAGENAGKVYMLIEPEGQDQATALRVDVLETARPEGWA